MLLRMVSNFLIHAVMSPASDFVLATVQGKCPFVPTRMVADGDEPVAPPLLIQSPVSGVVVALLWRDPPGPPLAGVSQLTR